MAGEQDLLEAGGQALAAGDWTAAGEAFRAALATAESGQALAGLGDVSWWLGDNAAALTYCERAYAAFRRDGELARAAELALASCRGHWAHHGNRAAAAGWLARARRLADENDLAHLRGWLALHEAMIADPAGGESWARKAHEHARRSADADLELCALSEIGAKVIGQGRVAEGVRYLDEAMAGALGGEAGSPETVVYTCCITIKACTSCAEFERATQWVRAADRFTEQYGNPFLYAQCRALYGAVLVATGHWARAEHELRTALDMSGDALPAVHTEALAAFADLRLAQGRIEEAERLVSGLDDQPAAVPVVARLHLARGRPAVAETVLQRWLAELGEDQVQRLALLELLGEAELAQGRPDAAVERARTLSDLGTSLECEVAVARGARLRGQALLATSDVAAAQAQLDTALVTFTRLAMPLEAARTRLLLAAWLRSESPQAAETEARTALEAFRELGAARDADAALALLRDLGVKASRPGPRTTEHLTGREREVLALLGEGLSNPEIAERLYISRRTVEDHVAHLLAKLGLRNRAEAAAEAVRRLGHEAGERRD